MGCNGLIPESNSGLEENITYGATTQDTTNIERIGDVSLDIISSEDSELSVNDKVKNIEKRIELIRDWFRQVESLRQSSECETIERVRYDSFDVNTEQMPFVQSVKTCKINDDFELVVGDFRSFHSTYSAAIYKRQGKIFFVFVNGASEGWEFEDRYYADENEVLIRHLKKMAFDEDLNTLDNEVVELTSAQSIRSSVEKSLEDIDWIIEAIDE
jgi:hypothetical protein